jgi:hypothetical protein
MKKPFILEFSIPGKSAADKSYFYDEELNLNVIIKNNLKTPFVDLDLEAIELGTKTEVKREGDEPSNDLLELETNPKFDNEHCSLSGNQLLELLTKTKVQREGDDE